MHHLASFLRTQTTVVVFIGAVELAYEDLNLSVFISTIQEGLAHPASSFFCVPQYHCLQIEPLFVVYLPATFTSSGTVSHLKANKNVEERKAVLYMRLPPVFGLESLKF